jgi:hypothetical protein
MSIRSDKDFDKDLPALHNLSVAEQRAIKQIFSFYDIGNTGRIKQHLAHSLFKQIGLGVKIDVIPLNVSLRDILLLADTRCPPDQTSEENVDIFCRIVSRERNGNAGPVRGSNLMDFLASVEKVAPSRTEAQLILSNMVEYDDCSDDPVVAPLIFKKDILAKLKEINEELDGGRNL